MFSDIFYCLLVLVTYSIVYILFTVAPLTCRSDQYRCTDNSRCIFWTWACDGLRDCDDNDDETNCSKTKHLEFIIFQHHYCVASSFWQKIKNLFIISIMHKLCIPFFINTSSTTPLLLLFIVVVDVVVTQCWHINRAIPRRIE